jgi:predicted RNA binding protein YcfA (HicA-like mRNA interferase family)
VGRGDPQVEGCGIRRGQVRSHLQLKHPTSGKEVWVAVHTKKDAGRLGNRILREAGVE